MVKKTLNAYFNSLLLLVVLLSLAAGVALLDGRVEIADEVLDIGAARTLIH